MTIVQAGLMLLVLISVFVLASFLLVKQVKKDIREFIDLFSEHTDAFTEGEKIDVPQAYNPHVS